MATVPDPDPELLAALKLALIPGIGPRLQQLLLERFHSAREIFAATEHELLGVSGVGRKLSTAILEGRGDDAAVREYRRCQELGVALLQRDTGRYPVRLGEIPDPPQLLYCHGEFLPRDALAVAIVGSRQCSHYGRRVAERLASALARAGVTVVSGLARGIDAAAHRGALEAGGRTIAVMATGLSNIYPPEHVELGDAVARQGALVSEASLNQEPIRGIFPQRNRIISGISLGVIVVEASRTSGSLHTARHALEQGREVFAVPGQIDNLASEGCHDLIRDGATLIRSAEDVLQGLGPMTQPVSVPTQAREATVRTPRELTLTDQERLVLNCVTADPIPIDQVLQMLDLETSRVLQTLTVLEMKRLIRRLPGGNLCRI